MARHGVCGFQIVMECVGSDGWEANTTTEERRNAENKFKVHLFPGTLVVSKKELQKWAKSVFKNRGTYRNDAKFWCWPARILCCDMKMSIKNRGTCV
jgi:hypothetical protein